MSIESNSGELDKLLENYDPLKELKWRLNEWSDEVPDKIMHGPAEDLPNEGRFKVRKNWWHGLMGDLHCALEDGVIPKTMELEVREFMNRYGVERDFTRRLTTKEDIEEANALIRKILEAN